MKYIVTFRKRFDEAGEGLGNPLQQLSLADGVVLDSAFVQRLEPPNRHVQEIADEDDAETSPGLLASGRRGEEAAPFDSGYALGPPRKTKHTGWPAAVKWPVEASLPDDRSTRKTAMLSEF